jgi:DNA-binding transcriptional ArsR family regulator
MTRLDQLRAMSDPLRVRMVERMVAREQTVADLARALGQPISRLYHHTDVLLQAGLVKVTRTRRRRGAEERFFRAVARDYVVDDRIFAFDEPTVGPEGLIELATSTLTGIATELTDAVRASAVDVNRSGRRVFLETQDLGLTEGDFVSLCELLDRWIAEAKGRSTARRRTRYRFGVAFFPRAAPGSGS